MDSNLNFKLYTTGYLLEKGTNDINKKYLRDILSYLMNTKYVNNETMLYIFNDITMKELNRALSESEDTDKNYGTCKVKITYGLNKIKEHLFPIINDLVNNTNTQDIDDRLIEVFGAFNFNSIANNLIIDLGKSQLTKELDEEKFKQFVSTIYPYTMNSVKRVIDSIPADCVGYFNYLIMSNNLSEIDKERLEKLKIILS